MQGSNLEGCQINILNPQNIQGLTNGLNVPYLNFAVAITGAGSGFKPATTSGTMSATFETRNCQDASKNGIQLSFSAPIFALGGTSAINMNGQSGSDLSCGAQTVTFSTSSVSNATSYEWNTSSLTNAGWSVVSQSNTSLTMTSTQNSGGSVTFKAKRDCKEESRTFTVTRPPVGGNATISGPAAICSSSAQYSVINLPAGATVTNWASSSFINKSCTNCNPITMSANGFGTGSISATISDGCGTTLRSRDVRVGTFQTSEMTINPSNSSFCVYQGNQFSCPFLSTDPADYQWQMFYSPGFSGSADKNSFFFTPQSSGSGAVTVRVRNACGWPSSPATYSFSVNFCGGGYGFRASPNPTKDKLTIEAINESSGEAIAAQTGVPADAEFTFELVTDKGKVLRQGTSKNLRTETDVKGIPRGTYFLKLTSGKKTENRQIAIEN